MHFVCEGSFLLHFFFAGLEKCTIYYSFTKNTIHNLINELSVNFKSTIPHVFSEEIGNLKRKMLLLLLFMLLYCIKNYAFLIKHTCNDVNGH